MSEVYQIATIGKGSLSIMPKPESGKLIDHAFSSLQHSGITKIVSLMENDEAGLVGLEEEEAYCRKYAMSFLQFPILDLSVPDKDAEFINLVNTLHDEAHLGEHIAVHCKAGIGRSGLLAVCILIRSGVSPAIAVSQVSEARGRQVPETDDQMKYILGICDKLGG